MLKHDCHAFTSQDWSGDILRLAFRLQSQDYADVTLQFARRIPQLRDIPVNLWVKVNISVLVNLWAEIWLAVSPIPSLFLPVIFPCSALKTSRKQKWIPKLYICGRQSCEEEMVPPTQAGRQAVALETQTPPTVATLMLWNIWLGLSDGTQKAASVRAAVP